MVCLDSIKNHSTLISRLQAELVSRIRMSGIQVTEPTIPDFITTPSKS